MSYKTRLDLFVREFDFSGGNTSNIWNSFRKDFQKSESSLRGYGLASISNNRIAFYRNVRKFLSLPLKVLSGVSERLNKRVDIALSWLILGDKFASVKYGFYNYKPSIYDTGDLVDFQNNYQKSNIGFSHNTFKSYSYLKRLKETVKLEKNLSVFEIGAGVFNFGHLLSLHLSHFEYVVCDLPEMISSAFKEINESYIPSCGGDYDVFLPTEIDKFEMSSSNRKILFITPEQLKSNCLGDQKRFDLFVNHESFSEMDIDVVNSYLGYLPKLLKKDSYVFLVNRHSRSQARSYEQYKEMELSGITCFSDYKLEFCSEVIKKIDLFRSAIPGQQDTPNVFYIGKVEV